MRLMIAAYGEESQWPIGVIVRYLAVMSSLTVESLLNLNINVLREALPFLSKVNQSINSRHIRMIKLETKSCRIS